MRSVLPLGTTETWIDFNHSFLSASFGVILSFSSFKSWLIKSFALSETSFYTKIDEIVEIFVIFQKVILGKRA